MTRALLRTAGTGLALLTAGLLLVGCEPAEHAKAAPPTGPSPTATATASRPAAPTPSRLDDSYFAEGSCAHALNPGGSGTTAHYETVPCDSPNAEAKVTKRSGTLTGVAAALPRGADCPDGTDVALDLTQNDLTNVTRNRAAWACLRNLHDPHPGEPGGGGGPGIVVGDCVYAVKSASGSGSVAETRCDGQGEHKPEYKVDKEYVKQTVSLKGSTEQTCPDEATVTFTIPAPPGTLAMNPTVACAEPVD
ncbi:LppU/SCO3897 family protein [Kitasatospora griseola]|uniref:LppU/SCO3897 family protein n=1 Tax=Kitasatospora griseola TaxID=2064 RepID=UPI0037F2F8F6